VHRHPRFYSTRRAVSWYRWFVHRLHKRRRFDVVHCHSVYPTGYIATCTGSLESVPMVITSHGGDVSPSRPVLSRPRIRERYRRALERANAVIAISEMTEERIRQLAPEGLRIERIPNGVDVDSLAGHAGRPESLDPTIQPGRYLFFIGRLVRRKGVDLLLDALSRLPPSEDLQLVIAGDGDQRAPLESQMIARGLQKRVRFVGKALGQKKAHLLQNALATVVPSREWESFGLVVIESYASGTPVIGTDLPGMRSLIRPHTTGLRVAANSADEVSRAVAWALDHPDQMQQMGEHAKDVSRQYDWSTIAERHLALFEELLEAKARSKK
jgi:glycosyltransferase involved in cell wall biosynthesis